MNQIESKISHLFSTLEYSKREFGGYITEKENLTQIVSGNKKSVQLKTYRKNYLGMFHSHPNIFLGKFSNADIEIFIDFNMNISYLIYKKSLFKIDKSMIDNTLLEQYLNDRSELSLEKLTKSMNKRKIKIL